MESLGLKPIIEILTRLGLPGEIPVDSDVQTLDIAELSGKAQRILGLNMLVNFYISEDVRNTSVNRMMVSIYDIYMYVEYLKFQFYHSKHFFFNK